MSNLVWSPVYRVLEKSIQEGDDLILIVVPFVKLDALKQLHWVQNRRVRVKVICRWRPEDLLTGSSDVEVFPYLKANGCELFLNPDIHLKLYIFASNLTFNTSGNLTLRGLGYSEHPNVEVGNMVTLTAEDWSRIYRIVESSRQVDDILYQRFKVFVEQRATESSVFSPPDLLGPTKLYTIASLPATETPANLASFYSNAADPRNAPEDVRRGVHDLVIFKIPENLSRTEFEVRLGQAFRQTPFVRDFVHHLRTEGSLRFGAVTDWIHQKCEDVPLPYRWEIKDNARIFYNWLAHFFPEITWDRPKHSQVIYWQRKAK